MRLGVGIGVLGLVLGIGAGVALIRSQRPPTTLVAPTRPTPVALASEDCAVRDDAELARAGTRPKESYEHEPWIANDASQRAMRAIEATLGTRFGENTKTATEQQLAHGLIGVATDHHAQQVVVVVDPDLVDSKQLQADLAGVAEHQRSPGSDLLGVRVQAGCHRAAELLEASKTIHGRDWHRGASKASYSVFLNARTSTYEFTFATGDRDVAEALKAKLGDRVTIHYGAVGRLPLRAPESPSDG